MADKPLLPFVDSARIQLVESQWLVWLAGAELARQLHFLVSERSAGYHHFWSERVFGDSNRLLTRRFSDWTRFRLAQLLKWAAFVTLFALAAGQILETSPVLPLFQAPALLFSALPYVFRLAFAFFFIAFQFIGLFWLLSRGGVDTYYPDDITTRFGDVWGQDHVVERIRENIMFLEKPDQIEQKGGYVPGGILLWGPPGTGKTLMAEAVARVGSPGGGHGGPKNGGDTETALRQALADRIEDHLGTLLERVEAILREDRAAVLAIAHALETHKTLSGEDIAAVVEGVEGPSADGRVYRDSPFVARLEEYHAAAAGAHRGHTGITLALPAGGRRVEGDTTAATPR